MTNNMRNNRFDRRATETARAATKAKAKKQNILFATISLALVAVIAGGVIAFSALNAKPQTSTAAPTAISAKADKAAQGAQTTAAQTAVKTDNGAQKVQTASAKTQTTAQQTTQQTAQKATQAASQDKIEKINGERVYIDTKRKAPEKTGTPAHYYANGKTSYGFDWDYSADNSNFTLSCNYNFDKQQYDFSFYGTKEGTSHVTLYYFTADNVKVPVSLTVNVDSSLNVSLA